MKRKVIQIADSTQLISLPRKWCLEHGIKKGDELEVSEEGTKLLVHTSKSPELGNAEVEIGTLDRDSIMFLVRALYKNGYDTITVRFKKPFCENIRTRQQERVIDVVSQEVARLNGVEIFTQKEDYCIIRSISEDTIKAFDTMLRRIFLLTIEAFNDLLEGYQQGNTAILETIQKKHDTITKFATYCQRLLNKIGYPNYKKTDILYHTLENIDSIVDLLKYSARNLISSKPKASSDGLAICKAIQKSFTLYYELHYSFGLDKAYELSKTRHGVMRMLAAAKPKMHKNEFSVLSDMEQVLEYVLNLTNSRMALEY